MEANIYIMETNIYINEKIIPVNPNKWSYKVRGDNTNHILLGVGEIAIPRIPKLATFGWSSFFPGDYSHPYVNPNAAVMRPAEWKDAILGLLNGREIIDLVVTREKPGDYASIPVVIDSFNYEERGGETGDLYYDISFSQYREYQPNQAVVVGFDDPDSSLELSYNYKGEDVTVAEFYTKSAIEEYEKNHASRDYSGSLLVYRSVEDHKGDPRMYIAKEGSFVFEEMNFANVKITPKSYGNYNYITPELYDKYRASWNAEQRDLVYDDAKLVKVEIEANGKTREGFLTESQANSLGIDLYYFGKDYN